MLQSQADTPIRTDKNTSPRSRIFTAPLLVFVIIGAAFAIGLSFERPTLFTWSEI